MTEPIARFVQAELAPLADPVKAASMAAYMKTDAPFYGIPNPIRKPVFRAVVRQFRPADHAEWVRNVLALWALPHREEKYAALWYARRFKAMIVPESLPLAERLTREGAWWDMVDDAIGGLVSPIYARHRQTIRPAMARWIEDDDLWIRRAAILAQKGHKKDTDAAELFDFCLRRSGETEFFIRKAIGWALRDYSYDAPEAVRDFLVQNRESLSGLSYREGAKRLVKVGIM